MTVIAFLGYFGVVIFTIIALGMFKDYHKAVEDESEIKMNREIANMGLTIITWLICASMALVASYFCINPVSRGYYKTTDRNTFNNIETIVVNVCEELVFAEDDCVIYSVTTRKFNTVYSEPKVEIINPLPE